MTFSMEKLMNVFDLIFLGLISTLFIHSFLKGFVKEFFSTLGLVIGFLAAGKFHAQYMHYAQEYLSNPDAAKLFTYIFIFFAGTIAGWLMGTLITIIFSLGPPSFSNRILGGFIGLVKGGLVSLVIFFTVRGYIPAYTDELDTSQIAPYLEHTWKFLESMGFAGT